MDSLKAWREGKKDKNGYAAPITGTESHFCFFCGRFGDTVRHEPFNGVGRRELCKEDGIFFNLCPACHKWEHEGGGLIFESGATLPQLGQMAYERNHTREEFMKRYGKNYL